MSVSKQDSLVKLPSKALETLEELEAACRSLEGRANIISPVAVVNSIPPLHAISLRYVEIDATVNSYGQGPEVYRDRRFCNDNEVALGGVAIQKIAAAAGVKMASSNRTDDRSDPNYCNVEVVLVVRDFDGMVRNVIKTKELDLRDGAPESMKPQKTQGGKKTGQMEHLDPSALADKRRNIQSNCESKAHYRGIRSILQLRQKYTLDELKKPFAVFKLVPNLDQNDPVQKIALIDSALEREATLYGHPQIEPAVLSADVPPRPTVDAANPASVASRVEPRIDECSPCETCDPVNEADFEVVEIEPEKPSAVCLCQCGCQAEISEVVSRITAEKCGSPRCKDCFPGPRFSYELHEHIADLRLPNRPGLTPAEIRDANKKAGKS